jgi:hypothetical protein
MAQNAATAPERVSGPSLFLPSCRWLAMHAALAWAASPARPLYCDRLARELGRDIKSRLGRIIR